MTRNWRWQFAARLNEVTDGDTVKLECDLGYGARFVCEIRLRGVNCAERFTPEGISAKAFVGQWMAEHIHGESWPLTVTTFQIKETDLMHRSFTRYIGDIVCMQEHSLRDALITSGNGVAGTR